MFFEQSEIKDLLKCENCSQPFNEYYSPRMLPCCAKTICNTCVQLTEKQAKNSKFKCIIRKEDEIIPEKGFPNIKRK
jgi:hypothetical protein